VERGAVSLRVEVAVYSNFVRQAIGYRSAFAQSIVSYIVEGWMWLTKATTSSRRDESMHASRLRTIEWLLNPTESAGLMKTFELNEQLRRP